MKELAKRLAATVRNYVDDAFGRNDQGKKMAVDLAVVAISAIAIFAAMAPNMDSSNPYAGFELGVLSAFTSVIVAAAVHFALYLYWVVFIYQPNPEQ